MNTNAGDFEIAPNFKASKWTRLDIQKSTAWNADWEKAIGALEHRINARFLNQIDLLISNKDRTVGKYAGFAIVALDCLLIETLSQFYDGIYRTAPKLNKADDPDVAAFHAVFQRSPALKSAFDKMEKTKVFYQQIRCGLLHQAETKSNSKINRKGKAAIEWCDSGKPAEGLVVHPYLFHECVKNIFSEYLRQLRDVPQGDLRGRFRKKMNRVAGM